MMCVKQHCIALVAILVALSCSITWAGLADLPAPEEASVLDSVISLEVHDATFCQALAALHEATDLNILALLLRDHEKARVATLSLQEVTLRELLSKLATAYDVTWGMHKGVLLVRCGAPWDVLLGDSVRSAPEGEVEAAHLFPRSGPPSGTITLNAGDARLGNILQALSLSAADSAARRTKAHRASPIRGDCRFEAWPLFARLKEVPTATFSRCLEYLLGAWMKHLASVAFVEPSAALLLRAAQEAGAPSNDEWKQMAAGAHELLHLGPAQAVLTLEAVAAMTVNEARQVMSREVVEMHLSRLSVLGCQAFLATIDEQNTVLAKQPKPRVCEPDLEATDRWGVMVRLDRKPPRLRASIVFVSAPDGMRVVY